MEAICDYSGNFSAQGVDVMLDALGLTFARRSVPVSSSDCNQMDVDDNVLRAYERVGYVGLIAFIGASNHYVAFRYSPRQECYIYMDSIVRWGPQPGMICNLGMYATHTVLMWLYANCFHMQDGERRAAFIWAVSERPLPEVRAGVGPDFSSTGTSSSAGTSSSTGTSSSAGSSTGSSAGTSSITHTVAAITNDDAIGSTGTGTYPITSGGADAYATRPTCTGTDVGTTDSAGTTSTGADNKRTRT